MIKNIDKFYENVTQKIPISSSVNRDDIIKPFTQTSRQTPAEVIHEMLAIESEYIRHLTVGIDTYLANDQVDDALVEKIRKIFGNIRQIRDFHANTFYSTLSDCRDDITKIANIFIKFTQVIC